MFFISTSRYRVLRRGVPAGATPDAEVRRFSAPCGELFPPSNGHLRRLAASHHRCCKFFFFNYQILLATEASTLLYSVPAGLRTQMALVSFKKLSTYCSTY